MRHQSIETCKCRSEQFPYDHSYPTSSALYIQLSTLQRTYRQNRLWKAIEYHCDKEPPFCFVRICHSVSNRDPLPGDGQRLEIPHKIIFLPDDRGSPLHMRDHTHLLAASFETCGVWCLASVLRRFHSQTLRSALGP